MMFSNYGFMGGFMWIFWIAVIVGIILLVKWTVQQSKPHSENQEMSSIEVLKKRYAQGEIERDEYEQRRKDLLS